MTKHNPKIHHRRSIRLKEYDYSQEGFYFITICTNHHVCLFGKIYDGKMVLNDAGKIAKECWLDVTEHYPNTRLHECVIMPNHVHGILQIVNNAGVGVQDIEPLQQPKQNQYQKIIPRSIGSMVRGFKIGVTKWFRKNTNVYTVWQRNYYEHIIRNEQSYYKISEYIIKNPSHWLTDKYYEQDF